MRFEAYRIGETDFECWDKLWKASPSDPDVDSEEWVTFSECTQEYFGSILKLWLRSSLERECKPRTYIQRHRTTNHFSTSF
jgi:hypothetical protein